MTNETGLEFEHLEQTGPSREEIQSVLRGLNQQAEQMPEDFDWSGFMMVFDGKHFNTIRAVLTQALERAR